MLKIEESFDSGEINLDSAKLVFESYNMVVEGSYDKVFSSNRPEDLLKIKEESVLQYLIEDLKRWAQTPINDLGGVSPFDYFQSINNLKHLMDLFRLGSKLCDKDLPDPLLQRLKDFKHEALDELMKLALDLSLLRDEEEMFASLMAIKIMGKWKIEAAVSPLIGLLSSLDSEDEIIIEEVYNTLIAIGDASISGIANRLNEIDRVSLADEYLLGSLVKISINSVDKTTHDMIYRCIKNTFNKMDDKVFGAMCLGDFGDGRAIPTLRGYVQKNRDSIDYETYCEIRAAVHRLGGNMDDLNISFKEIELKK